ncbi:MAG: glutathione S-transferase family protein [Deltaproteobacteria bacterium]|nr:glutathione S-transferase family protein [Deltaproteobacteria bacterium]
MPKIMRLYSHPVQPNAIRVLMFLDEKGLEVPIVNVDMLENEHRSPEYLKKNPRGQVPTLELDDGTCITESIVICRYLDEISGEPHLFGDRESDRAVISMWERVLELGLFIPVIEYGHHTLTEMKDYFDQYPDWAESLRGGIEATMDRLTRQLEKNPYIAGEKYTVADITGFLGAKYAEMIVGLDLPATGPVADWIDKVAPRDSASSFHTSLDLMPDFMEKFTKKDWRK